MFRRFGWLQARVLLHKQDELIELENRLFMIDSEERTDFFLCCRRHDPCLERKALIEEAEKQLKSYSMSIPVIRAFDVNIYIDEMLASYYQNIERPRPHNDKVTNFANWLDGVKPLDQPESTFLSDLDDLRSPSSNSDRSGLDVLLAAWISSAADYGLRVSQFSRLYRS